MKPYVQTPILLRSNRSIARSSDIQCSCGTQQQLLVVNFVLRLSLVLYLSQVY